MKNNKGFTLMELMIVIAIIMILAGAIVARISTSSEKAMEAKAMADLETIAAACRAFYADVGYWPYRVMALTSKDYCYYTKTGNPDSDIVFAGASWKGPYLSFMPTSTPYGSGYSVPKDPWDVSYELFFEGPQQSRTMWARCGGQHTNLKILVHRF